VSILLRVLHSAFRPIDNQMIEVPAKVVISEDWRRRVTPRFLQTLIIRLRRLPRFWEFSVPTPSIQVPSEIQSTPRRT